MTNAQPAEIPSADPLVVAVALSLYAYNVSPGHRAEALYRHFDGACAEPEDLLRAVQSCAPATELAMPSAAVYVAKALQRYLEEARERVAVNLPGYLSRTTQADALQAVLLFHDAAAWDEKKRKRWKMLTGTDDATTKSLCDAVRRALGL